MRKTSAALATLSLAVLALTGCTAAPTSGDASCERAGGNTDLRDAVSVEGDIGGRTDVDLFTPLSTPKSSFADLVVGDGRALADDGQAMLLQLSIYDGSTGEKIYDEPFDEATSAPITIDQWAQRVPGLAPPLECATAGSRVVAALTPEDFGPQNAANFGIEDDGAAVFVLDVVDVYLPKAEGALRFNDARNMPTVVRAPDGTPGVIIPDVDAPDKQTVQTLIEGDGEKLTADQLPLVHFTAVGWDDKQVLRTTWGDAPIIDFAQLAPPIAEALVGHTVGSQVLIVAPKTEGSAAMAFVVDILGAVPVPSP